MLRAVTKDLLTMQPRPLPPLSWPRGLRWLPHVLVLLSAVALSLTGADLAAKVLAISHAAMLLVALRWPVPAWWLSLGFVLGIALGHPPTADNELWAWLVHAEALFLLTLRIRPVPAVVATGVSMLVATGCLAGSWRLVVSTVVFFGVALLAGSLARMRRESRDRLTAQMAATAHERAERTVLEERTRIARELHDVVAHHMSVISVKAEAAPYRVQDPPPELVAEFAAIRASAVDGLAELRRLVGVLRSGTEPATAPQPSLDQLETLAENVRAAGLPVVARIDGTPRPVPAGVELSAYRIVQEALSNALRHAPGAETTVAVTYQETLLRLRISNGPATSSAPSSPGTGHGLIGMRERTAMLGGDLATGPTPEGGYEVAAALPLPDSTKDTPS
ncbi:sensor histidine kinase [Amycolatopsis silviterrae]|uniref:histidine kinase n=1 Tax=Amycolatopsis silviterrae TaxID=1656914 RepID=A0ABW5H1M8_9PSEU